METSRTISGHTSTMVETGLGPGDPREQKGKGRRAGGALGASASLESRTWRPAGPQPSGDNTADGLSWGWRVTGSWNLSFPGACAVFETQGCQWKSPFSCCWNKAMRERRGSLAGAVSSLEACAEKQQPPCKQADSKGEQSWGCQALSNSTGVTAGEIPDASSKAAGTSLPDI